MSQIPFEQRSHEDSTEADPIHENIQDIVELHKRAENEVSKQQRIIEDMTDFIGRPRFLLVNTVDPHETVKTLDQSLDGKERS